MVVDNDSADVFGVENLLLAVKQRFEVIAPARAPLRDGPNGRSRDVSCEDAGGLDMHYRVACAYLMYTCQFEVGLRKSR